MKALGHGISDAVRNHIPIWIDDGLVDVLYEEYKKSDGVLTKESFRIRIKSSSSWVRKNRIGTNSGWERKYHCKTVQKATLTVHSPTDDMSANGYVFCIDGKPIAGGKTKLKSTLVSSSLSKKDKTSTHTADAIFIKFTEEELRKMRYQAEFGDGFDRLEWGREE